MRSHTTKVQPLTLNCLLELRKQLERRLKAMHAEGVTQTGPLEDLYDRCQTAIHHAQVERRISATRFNLK